MDIGGYNGFSMSNRAVEAYKNGLVPFSKLSSRLRNLIKKLDGVECLMSEWHHTSKYYNITYFYNKKMEKIFEFYPKRIKLYFKICDYLIKLKLKNYISFLKDKFLKEKPAGFDNLIDFIKCKVAEYYSNVTLTNGKFLLRKSWRSANAKKEYELPDISSINYDLKIKNKKYIDLFYNLKDSLLNFLEKNS